jgi:hypothetical protein
MSSSVRTGRISLFCLRQPGRSAARIDRAHRPS